MLIFSEEDPLEKGYPLQYSDQENSMDCIVHGVAKSQTQLGNFHTIVEPFLMFISSISIHCLSRVS